MNALPLPTQVNPTQEVKDKHLSHKRDINVTAKYFYE